MKRCQCSVCIPRRHRWHAAEGLAEIPPWGHDALTRLDDVLIRLAALEGNMTDFSGLDQAISDQKTVDDQILAKLDELTTQVGAANSQGDQQQVSAAVVQMQQHIADVRAALTKSEGGAHEATPASSDPNAQAPAPSEPEPAAGDGAVPPSQPGSAPQPPAAADAPASSEPASAPAQPVSGGDAVQSAPPAGA